MSIIEGDITRSEGDTSCHVIRPEAVYGNGGRYSPPLTFHWFSADRASVADQ